MNIVITEAIRIIILTTIGFLVALIFTPIWYRFLKKYRFGKHMRLAEEAPVFYELHKKKEGTLTGAGVIIWGTVIFLAILFGIINSFFGGMWSYLNFLNRAETYLPLAALFIAAVLGFIDDWFGVMHIGGAPGGGLRVRDKSIIYIILAGITARSYWT